MDSVGVRVNQTFADFMTEQGLHHAAPSFAVAVSGGADSLCLVLTAQDWVKEGGGRLVALTVDHGLRSESKEEALRVKTWMNDRGIEHHTITHTGDTPQAGIQSWARQIRYGLLFQACKDLNCPYLLVGHHQQDQHETFFMRLAAGSGPHGLAVMAPITKRKGIQILRPFLKLPSQVLQEDLRERGQEWIEDPSNKDLRYTRVQLREMLKTQGLSASRLDDVIGKLQEDRDYFEDQVQAWCAHHIEGEAPLFIHVHAFNSLPSLHPSLFKRILPYLIREVTCRPTLFNSRQIQNLMNKLKEPNFSATTMGGCYFLKRQRGLHIQRELRAIQDEISTSALPYLWDQRILLTPEMVRGEGIIRPMGKELIGDLKRQAPAWVPSAVWPTLPCVWQRDGKLWIPHLQVEWEAKALLKNTG